MSIRKQQLKSLVSIIWTTNDVDKLEHRDTERTELDLFSVRSVPLCLPGGANGRQVQQLIILDSKLCFFCKLSILCTYDLTLTSYTKVSVIHSKSYKSQRQNSPSYQLSYCLRRLRMTFHHTIIPTSIAALSVSCSYRITF